MTTPEDRTTTTVLLRVPKGTHGLMKMLAATTKRSVNDLYSDAARGFAARNFKPSEKGRTDVPVAASAESEISRLVALSREIQAETAPQRKAR